MSVYSGFLRYQGGIKFVLKRTDGGHPEWIKPSDHADFFVDFAQPIKLFQALNSGAEEAALASSLGLPDGAFGPKERSAAAADSIDDWGWARALASDDEGPRVEDIVALFGVDDQEVAKKVPGGWLRGVSRWEDLGDMNPPHTNHSLSDQVQQLRAILLAARAHPEVDEEETLRAQRADQVAALLARCDEVTGTLHTYDMASLEATRVLHEKNALWESHKGATDEVAHLQNEVTAAVDAARRAVVALRGRRAEVTVRDLEAVAAQMAESTVKGGSVWPFSAFGGRQLAFVSERVMSVAGVDASVLVQIYLEGDKSAVAAALAPKPAEPQSEPAPPVEGRAEAAEQPVSALGPSEEGEEDGDAAPSDPLPSTAAPKGGAKAAAPAFDTVVVAVAAGEAFPDVGLPPPLMLHFGAVSHEFGRWRAPPAGWRSEPGVEGGPPGSLPWVPLQQFSIQRPDGSPAFVDAQLHAACVRLPLKDVAAARIRGLEFVLKTGDGRWLKQGGGNFYAELPLLLR